MSALSPFLTMRSRLTRTHAHCIGLDGHFRFALIFHWSLCCPNPNYTRNILELEKKVDPLYLECNHDGWLAFSRLRYFEIARALIEIMQVKGRLIIPHVKCSADIFHFLDFPEILIDGTLVTDDTYMDYLERFLTHPDCQTVTLALTQSLEEPWLSYASLLRPIIAKSRLRRLKLSNVLVDRSQVHYLCNGSRLLEIYCPMVTGTEGFVKLNSFLPRTAIYFGGEYQRTREYYLHYQVFLALIQRLRSLDVARLLLQFLCNWENLLESYLSSL